MPFDPTLPTTGSAISSAELRNQFTGLKALIPDASTLTLLSVNITSPPTQAQVQAILDGLNQVINILKGAPPGVSKATNPFPPNGAMDVSRMFNTFNWTGGPAKIYFGTTSGMLAYVTTVTGPPVDLLTLLMLMGWDSATTYYWRIDIIDPATGGTVPGDEWSFTTEM